jgi:hypothetical protein
MTTKYDYESAEEFVKDRAFDTHIGLKSCVNNELLFGNILRNELKHAFQCGIVNAGGEIKDSEYG